MLHGKPFQDFNKRQTIRCSAARYRNLLSNIHLQSFTIWETSYQPNNRQQSSFTIGVLILLIKVRNFTVSNNVCTRKPKTVSCKCTQLNCFNLLLTEVHVNSFSKNCDFSYKTSVSSNCTKKPLS